MTREEAKKILDTIRSYYIGQAIAKKNEYPKETIGGYSFVNVSNACLQGSKALEQEPCEDCISREAVLKLNKSHHGQMSNEINHQIWKEIKALPSVQLVRKKGDWIEKDDGWGGVYYDCSVCGESWTLIDGTPWENGMKFCPHCGAEMEGINENS